MMILTALGSVLEGLAALVIASMVMLLMFSNGTQEGVMRWVESHCRGWRAYKKARQEYLNRHYHESMTDYLMEQKRLEQKAQLDAIAVGNKNSLRDYIQRQEEQTFKMADVSVLLGSWGKGT